MMGSYQRALTLSCWCGRRVKNRGMCETCGRKARAAGLLPAPVPVPLAPAEPFIAAALETLEDHRIAGGDGAPTGSVDVDRYYLRAVGITQRSLIRVRNTTGTIRVDTADRMAVTMGHHPATIWGWEEWHELYDPALALALGPDDLSDVIIPARLAA